MDKSVQHRSILALPVIMQQDTTKGTWVDATGAVIAADAVPLGVTQHDAAAGETVAVTVLGTASMDLNGIATAAVMQSDVICLDTGSMVVKTASTALTAGDHIYGVVLYDAATTAHAEVLIK